MGLFNEPQDESVFHLGIDDTARAYMLETARWTKFLAIIGLVTNGLLVCIALIPGYLLTLIALIYPSTHFVVAVVGYALFLAACLYPAITLLKFSINIKAALLQADTPRFNAAMKNQRNLFRYLGIQTIVIIGLYGVLILLVVRGTSFS